MIIVSFQEAKDGSAYSHVRRDARSARMSPNGARGCGGVVGGGIRIVRLPHPLARRGLSMVQECGSAARKDVLSGRGFRAEQEIGYGGIGGRDGVARGKTRRA
jgi:hypothetical protein